MSEKNEKLEQLRSTILENFESIVAEVSSKSYEAGVEADHKSHNDFENELYATLVDPVAEGQIKESEMRKQLLESARWYRQHVHDLEDQTGKFIYGAKKIIEGWENLAAEKILGRRLRKGEQVHHGKEGIQVNTEGNLKVAGNIAKHRELEGKRNFSRRIKGQPNPIIVCACGCGETFQKFDSSGRPRKFVSGHNVGGKRG